jgi:hypothetical protein
MAQTLAEWMNQTEAYVRSVGRVSIPRSSQAPIAVAMRQLEREHRVSRVKESKSRITFEIAPAPVLSPADLSQIVLNRLFVEADLRRTKQMTEAEIVALEPRLVGADLAPIFAGLLGEQRIARTVDTPPAYTLTLSMFSKLLDDLLDGLEVSREARDVIADLFPNQ